MDIPFEQIAAKIVELLTLYVIPTLIAGGKGIAQKVGEKIEDKTAEWVWQKLQPKVEENKKAGKTLEMLMEDAEDEDARDLLEKRIVEILKENPELAKEIQSNVTVSAGDGSFIAGRDVKKSKIALGPGAQVAEQIFNIKNEASPAMPVSTERLREKYLKALVEKCEKLPLGTIHQTLEEAEHEMAIPLDKVYIDLDVRPRAREERAQKNLEMGEREESRIPIENALADEKMRRVVLLGEAGSGKTTCVNSLMIALALKQKSPLANRFPVRLILREVSSEYIPADVKKGGVDILWNALRGQLDREIGKADTEKFFPDLKNQIETEPCLIVLDGLDEVSEVEERRPRLLEAVAAFSRNLHKDSILLVTARPYAYDNPKWHLPKFATLELLGFSPEQVERFIERFYHAIQPIKNWDDAFINSRRQKLNEAIKERDYLQKLAERPLLLTLIASVDSSGAKLPEDRAELYEQTINLLLQRWQQRKDDGAGETNTTRALSYTSDILDALKKLAYEVHKRQAYLPATEGAENTPADINKHEIWEAFESSLLKNGTVTLDDLLDFLEKRAGLLVGRGDKVYAFAHRSFQEYLAARHVISTPGDEFNLKALMQSGSSWWREVILLAIAQINRNRAALKSAFNELYGFVPCDVEKKSNKIELDWQAAIIAGEALAEMRLKENERNEEYYKIYIERIANWLVQLLEQNALSPRERAEAGDTLAKLGDPRPGVGCPPSLQGKGPGVGSLDFLFCRIPKGKFLMGSKKGEEGSSDNEHPQFEYHITEDYFMSRYPITNAQFDLFVQADGYKIKTYWDAAIKSGFWSEQGFKGRYDVEVRTAPIGYSAPFNLPNHPAVGVSWYEAVAFCKWLTGQIQNYELGILNEDPSTANHLKSQIENRKMEIYLPTEAEWERAARGGKSHRYPWDDKITPNHANYADTNINATSAVGAFPLGTNDYGLLDMSGNVWEWCATKWQGNYEDYLKKEKELNNLEGDSARVLRGGSYGNGDWGARCAARYYNFPFYRYDDIGFRVVVRVVSPISP